MDTDNTKQIVIGYHAIESACDAILKPIKTELGDSETVAKMPIEIRDTLEWLIIDCKRIQRDLERMDYISDLEKDVGADEELAKVGEKIKSILFGIEPPSNTLENTNPAEFSPFTMEKYAKKVVMGVK